MADMNEWVDELFYHNLPTYAIDDKYLLRLKAAITAKMQEIERETAKRELDNLSYMTAKNGWHGDSVYKLWAYVAERQAELSKEGEK